MAARSKLVLECVPLYGSIIVVDTFFPLCVIVWNELQYKAKRAICRIKRTILNYTTYVIATTGTAKLHRDQ